MNEAASLSLPIASSRRQTAFEYVVTAIAFVVAYGQAPLYYSNQNQYFLHGLANAGVGRLSDDWLARTLDPTPVFSALVSATARYLQPWMFQIYMAAMMGIYAISLLSIFDTLAGDAAPRRRLAFAALLVLTHSAAARWASYQLFDKDYPWFLQAGLAGQYVLGSMLQPSVFGVLMVGGVALFMRGRALAAIIVTVSATIFHPTYLLPAAILTLGFMASLAASGEYRRAIAVGVVALVIALPPAVYAMTTFGPTTDETFAEAQSILANFRIPHHTQPRLWFDGVAAVQILWVLLAIVLARGNSLFPLLVTAFLCAAALTFVQMATKSTGLALLFPWRVSAVLVPVATAIVLARLILALGSALTGLGMRVAAGVLMALLEVVGVWSSFGRHAFSMPPEELPVMEFVRQTDAPGDVYFVPVTVPDLTKQTRGSLSSDFKPLPQKRTDAQIIPLDLQRFRLHTGAPIYIDFKSVPYKDVEVIEWRNRVRVAEEVEHDIIVGETEKALAILRAHGVTHLVLPAAIHLVSPNLRTIFDTDPTYRVYKIEPDAKTP
jgi:uncharacterized protein DUF6798